MHAYACDCVTHHLFHPNGSDCLGKEEDEDMMHQVAADDSLQRESELYSLDEKTKAWNLHLTVHTRSSHLLL